MNAEFLKRRFHSAATFANKLLPNRGNIDDELRAVASRQSKMIAAERQLLAWDRADARELREKNAQAAEEARKNRARWFPWEKS